MSFIDKDCERRANTIELCVDDEYDKIDSDKKFYSALENIGLKPTKVTTSYDSESNTFEAVYSFSALSSPLKEIRNKEKLGEIVKDIDYRSVVLYYPDGYKFLRLGR